MSDDEEPGSGSALLWYAAGRSSGYSSGEADGYERGDADGYRDGEHAALRVFNAKQDAQYRAGWRTIHIDDFKAWMALLEREKRRNAELQDQVESLTQSANAADRRSHEFCRKASLSDDFDRGMQDCLWALLQAAEQGKTTYAEYSELKSIVYQMNDAWAQGEILCRPGALGPRIAALMRALAR
jgi:hypothetical protein